MEKLFIIEDKSKKIHRKSQEAYFSLCSLSISSYTCASPMVPLSLDLVTFRSQYWLGYLLFALFFPFQVLTRPDSAQLPRSDEIGRIQAYMAKDQSIFYPSRSPQNVLISNYCGLQQILQKTKSHSFLPVILKMTSFRNLIVEITNQRVKFLGGKKNKTGQSWLFLYFIIQPLGHQQYNEEFLL